MDLFDRQVDSEISSRMPLAARMRPRAIEEMVGQNELLGEGSLLRRLLDDSRHFSAVFFGPPGTGKTSLVRIIGNLSPSHFVSLSAVDSSVARVRGVIEEARHRLAVSGKTTLLFVDEFHRFNRAQQEVLLPHIEEGLISFIGLTTANPFHSLAPALLSRSHLFRFESLGREEITRILKRALSDRERGLGGIPVKAEAAALAALARFSEGDARRALNWLEVAVSTTPPSAGGEVLLTPKSVSAAISRKFIPYDAGEDEHYDTISAFIKSIRGSDPDASLYWLAKMLRGGEDPRFIARRLVILASEDIGNADPRALSVAVDTFRAVEYVGLPECRINLAQAVCYLATAPKSNASYLAIGSALKDVDEKPVLKVPGHLKTSDSGAGKGYLYPHDHRGGWVEQKYIDRPVTYYRPTDRGYEKIIKKFMDGIRLREGENKEKDTG